MADLHAGALGDEVATQLSILCGHADGPNGSCREQPLALLDHLQELQQASYPFEPCFWK